MMDYFHLNMDRDHLLSRLLVRGELSNYKMYPSGHHYFTLKDGEGALRCVMFRGDAVSLRFRPENGMQVIAAGRVTVFPRDGQYQMYCARLTPEGVGDLALAFEQLKEKLARKIEDPKVYDLMCVYINNTSGLPLGYQTSQLLALLFLDEFDHWVKEKLHAKYYGRYMDDFYIISDSKEFLQGCWRQINGRMDALKLELNEKTAIFPLRNGLNFLGFHTYLDNGGAVIMKLRQDSLDRMKARTRGWRKDKEAGTLDVARTVNRWKAWDAHAAHGDTFELRKQIAAIVSEITGVTCTARPPIRAGKYDKAKEAVRKVNRQRRRPPAPAQQKVPTGFPW